MQINKQIDPVEEVDLDISNVLNNKLLTNRIKESDFTHCRLFTARLGASAVDLSKG